MAADQSSVERPYVQLRPDEGVPGRIRLDCGLRPRKPLKSQGFHGFESHPCRHLPAETRLAGPGYEAPSRRVLTKVLTSRQSAVLAMLRRPDPGARRRGRGPRPS